MNQMKTVALLGLLTALFLFIGRALGGPTGFIFALMMAGVMNVAAYWWSDKIVLKMHGAKPLAPQDAPELYSMVQNLAERAQLPMPKLYLIEQAAPNAFATGRNPENAAVAVTAGLLNTLERDEVEGVLAHELSHVKNRDTLTMTIAATLAGALSMLADMAMWSGLLGGRSSDDGDRHPLAGLAGIIIAPIAAMLIQMAISRTREFQADATGARVSGNPLSLARALQKIDMASKHVPIHTGSPATAHMFIINPFHGGLAGLFSTHPATAARVSRLEELARRGPAIRD